MKITLLFYTDNWEAGPTIEMEHIPLPGSVVWVNSGSRNDDGTEMYYVDNVMYPEKGVDKHNSIYLYVRPYTGYLQYGPLTEGDRLGEKLDKITAELKSLRQEIAELNLRGNAIGTELSKMSGDVADRQTEISGSLDNIAYVVEAIKETME